MLRTAKNAIRSLSSTTLKLPVRSTNYYRSLSIKRSLEPFRQLAQPYSHVGMLSFCGYKIGSAVYLGNQMAATAGHCVSELHPAYHFSLNGKKWIPVSRIIKHEKYREDRPERGNFDLAIMQLESEVPLAPLTVDYTKVDARPDCVAVGYPSYYAPRKKDDSDAKLMSTSFTRIAVKTTCSYSSDSPGVLRHQIGYKPRVTDGKIEAVEQPFDSLDSGTMDGMSGGGVFNTDKLISIIAAGNPINEKGAFNYFTSLSFHQHWLEQSIATLKTLNEQKLELEKPYNRAASLIQESIGISCKVLPKSEDRVIISLNNRFNNFTKLIRAFEGIGICIRPYEYAREVRQSPFLFQLPTHLEVVGESVISLILKLEKMAFKQYQMTCAGGLRPT